MIDSFLQYGVQGNQLEIHTGEKKQERKIHFPWPYCVITVFFFSFLANVGRIRICFCLKLSAFPEESSLHLSSIESAFSRNQGNIKKIHRQRDRLTFYCVRGNDIANHLKLVAQLLASNDYAAIEVFMEKCNSTKSLNFFS